MAKEFFKAKTILEPIEFWGNWRIPQKGKSPEELPGLLKFQTNSHGKLVVCGNLTNTPLYKMETYPVLWGTNVDSHKAISIFDAFVSRISFIPVHKNQPVTISFSEYWEGNVFFKNRDDVKFKSISFGINNLEMWHNTSYYDSTYDDKLNTIKMTYKRPKKVELFEDENVYIYLGYNVSAPGWGYGQNTASIKQTARIVIKSKRGKLLKFYGDSNSYQYYMEMIFYFLSLMIGKNTFIYDINGIRKNAKKENGKVITLGLSATRYFRHNIVDTHLNTLNILDVALPYYQVKDCLKDAILKYNHYHSKISRLVFDLVEYQKRWQPIDHHLLSQFIFLFEGIIRTLYKTEVSKYHKTQVLTDEYENMKNSILANCKNEQKVWLNNKLPPYPKFREYYDVAFMALDELFPYMIESKENGTFSTVANNMFKYLKTERTKVAHAIEEPEPDIYLYFHTISWLHSVLIFAIWKKCEISMEILKSTMKNHYPVYKPAQEYISYLLSEQNKKKNVQTT